MPSHRGLPEATWRRRERQGSAVLRRVPGACARGGWSERRDPGWTARASRLARRVVSHGGPPAGGGASLDGGGGVPVGWSDLAGGAGGRRETQNPVG
ncbi:hypothetical protein N7540_003510 [Penicillium herquei]|nr:hypothetical protein N7540_003510 [Penicillium herquei]